MTGPAGRLYTIAVTGTNGKTTTTSMVDAIVAQSGEPSARVTTLGSWVDGRQIASTTDLDAFFGAVAAALDAGVRTLALEVTSKALRDGFARHWPANVAVFTNLTRDHFDYHESPEHYLAAKAQLFTSLPADGVAVLNAKDAASVLLLDVLPPGVRVAGFRVGPTNSGFPEESVALAAEEVQATPEGTRVKLGPSPLAEALGGELSIAALGRFNVENALAAAVAADAAGYPARAIRAGLAAFGGVPGRLEVVWRSPMVLVDYAHTPDALGQVLKAARALGGGRVWAVFGCGGDRDRGKRPEMGRVAARHADGLVLTSDNPRGEEPAAIVEEIRSGMEEGPERAERTVRVVVELDRERAIRLAIHEAERDDIVVICGKGHERLQVIGGRSVELSDTGIALSACRARFEEKSK
ncbi:MAG: UDP-N-acetylmuramyl-tripeptide synthetase [Myxococcales bacterium]|nr:UDP-N-acetylmuramyl-tripeptide synthetase [Myxococcales bacterium]MCB9578607.1 UDP-N-acetylmuramyl-tripeptide synthetase [Polyangiaceae bacterium]